MTDLRPVGTDGTPVEIEGPPDLTAVLRRQWPVWVTCAVLGLLAAQLFTWVSSPQYEARSTLLLIAGENESSPSGGRARTVDVDTWATVARSTELLQKVAADLGLDLSVVQARTSATAAATGDILVLASLAPSVEQAVEGASVYSTNFLETRQAAVNASTAERRQRLEDRQKSLQSEIDDLDTQITTARRSQGTSSSAVAALESSQRAAVDRLSSLDAELDLLGSGAATGRVVVEPSTAVTRTGLGDSVILLSGLLAGLLVGFVLALVRDRYDDRYRSVDAFDHFGIEEIARLPYEIIGDDDYDDDGSSGAAPAYGRLLARLAFGHHSTPDLGRAVLLLPIESTTIPDDAAEFAALQLRAGARQSGISVFIARNTRPATVRTGRRQTAENEKMSPLGKALATRDLVLVPRPALDGRPEGIGLAGVVDATVLLVSDDTRVTTITQVIEDLVGVGATDIKIAVLTGVKSFGSSSRKGWRHRLMPHRRDETDGPDEI